SFSAGRARIEQSGLESRALADFVFALESDQLLRRECDKQRMTRLEMTFQIEAANEGRKIQPGTAPGLPGVARLPKSNRFLEIRKAATGLVGDPAGGRPAVP